MKMAEKLRSLGIPFEQCSVPNWSPIARIFVRDPAGTYVELAFAGEAPPPQMAKEWRQS